MADFIMTYCGVRFYPLDPNSEDIEIMDIAHALSMMTRANGHFKHFYSVAQHSINCAKEAKQRGYSKRVQLGCLLHDGSEAYLSDITRPVKKHLANYKEIEHRLQTMIFDKFGLGDLQEEEKYQIFGLDDTLLYYEFLLLKDYRIFKEKPEILSAPDVSERKISEVKAEFITMFEELKCLKN